MKTTETLPSFFEKLVSYLEKNSSYHAYALDLAHTPEGNYLLDSCLYGSSVARRSNIFHSCFEPAICVVMDHLAQFADTFIDIGANIGYYTLRMSPHVKQVYALEPSSPLGDLLQMNVALAELGNIHYDRYALTDDSRQPLNSKNSTVWTHTKDLMRTITFDEFISQKNLPPSPTLIKIDVDGFEGKVLGGMKHFLQNQKHQADLILELTPHHILRYGSSANEIFHFLQQLGYTIYQIIEGSNGGKFQADVMKVFLNDTCIGGLKKVATVEEMIGKEANCVVTQKKLETISSQKSFLKRKQEIIELIDNQADLEHIFFKIKELQNPLFEDQWLRFLALTQNHSLEKTPSLSSLDNLPCYQLRRGWTYVYQNQRTEARNAFLKTARHSSHFFKIKAAVGLYRLGVFEKCLEILHEIAADETKKVLSGKKEDYLETLKLSYLLKERKSRKTFYQLLMNVVGEKEDWTGDEAWLLAKCGFFSINLTKKLFSLPYLKSSMRKKRQKSKKARHLQKPILLPPGKTITSQAQFLDPLHIYRKNKFYYLFEC